MPFPSYHFVPPESHHSAFNLEAMEEFIDIVRSGRGRPLVIDSIPRLEKDEL